LGDADSPLHEYSCRQWSGLLNDFYKPDGRNFLHCWRCAFPGKDADLKGFDKSISQWNGNGLTAIKLSGAVHWQQCDAAKVIYYEYRKIIGAAYE